MANQSPHDGRLAKKELHRPGNLQQLLGIMWRNVLEADAIKTTIPEDAVELRLKAIHATIQAGSAYARLLEVGELEARMVAIEQALQGTAA